MLGGFIKTDQEKFGRTPKEAEILQDKEEEIVSNNNENYRNLLQLKVAQMCSLTKTPSEEFIKFIKLVIW